MKKVLLLVLCLLVAVTGALAKQKKSDESFKDKLGIGIDVVDREGFLRFWVSDGLALEFSAGINYTGGTPSTTGFNLGGGIAVPLVENDTVNMNLLPGIRLNYSKTSQSTTVIGTTVSQDSSDLDILFGVGLEFEAFIGAVSPDFSISSGAGLGFGFRNTASSVTGSGAGDFSVSTTNFILAIGSGFAINPVVLRYYF